jgi:hypothetical protein
VVVDETAGIKVPLLYLSHRPSFGAQEVQRENHRSEDTGRGATVAHASQQVSTWKTSSNLGSDTSA